MRTFFTWSSSRLHSEVPSPASSSFGPNSVSRRAASSPLSPVLSDVPSPCVLNLGVRAVDDQPVRTIARTVELAWGRVRPWAFELRLAVGRAARAGRSPARRDCTHWDFGSRSTTSARATPAWRPCGDYRSTTSRSTARSSVPPSPTSARRPCSSRSSRTRVARVRSSSQKASSPSICSRSSGTRTRSTRCKTSRSRAAGATCSAGPRSISAAAPPSRPVSGSDQCRRRRLPDRRRQTRG